MPEISPRRRFGVTDAMIETFGDVIFDLSHNLQIRRGDPVRELDFAAIEQQRADVGLSDGEIASRIGLTRAQVLFIRALLERRRFETGHYRRLNALGGGKRYRVERQKGEGDAYAGTDAGESLRQALRFDSRQSRRYVDQGLWQNDTIRGWLERHAAERPDAPALGWADGGLTYGELVERVCRLASGLHGLGIGRGDVVAVQAPNLPEYLITYFAVTWLGGVMTTLYVPYRAREMESQLGHSHARAIVCADTLDDFAAATTALELRPRLPDLAHVIAHGDPVAGAESLTALMEAEAVDIPDPPPVAADPFLLLFTSGTTDAPKGVPLTSHAILGNARLCAPIHGIGPDDVILSAPPFGHLFALYAVHLALAVGACSYLLPAFTPPALVEAVEAGKPTVVLAAPAHIAASAALLEAADLATLRLVILSGSAVSRDLATRLDAMLNGGVVTQVWGMTELQAGTLTRPDDTIDVIAGSAGRPSPGTEVRILDGDGRQAPTVAEGELQVRGPSVFPGYLANETANRDGFTDDGWFRTGDLASVDAAGNLSLRGRLKDLIDRGGVKYNPLDVEALLDRHPDVEQSAIVPMPDPVLGEKACCFAIPAPGKSLDLGRLCAYLAENGVAKTKFPERLEIVDAMPLTPTRKVIKGRLKVPDT